MGRPPRTFSEEDRDKIKRMAGCGIRRPDIAKVFQIGEKALRRHCKEELKTGDIMANFQVAETLHRLALEGNVAACIFWMKARAAWTERHEVTGKGSADLIPRLNLDDRVEFGKALAFTLAEAAHNMPTENTEPKV